MLAANLLVNQGFLWEGTSHVATKGVADSEKDFGRSRYWPSSGVARARVDHGMTRLFSLFFS